MTEWSNVPDDQLDARLSVDLRTLADGAVEPDRWSRWHLLSAVRTRIEPRPTGRSRSRLAPMAATGGLAVLLVLLAVSAPAFVPGASTPSPAQTPPSSWSGLNTREFSEALAAGRLRGEAVVVTGGLDMLDVPCQLPAPCDRYSLAGAKPSVVVRFHPLPAPEGAGERAEVEGVDWAWWQWPDEPPNGASLVLSVTVDGKVDYVGWKSEQPMGIDSFAVVHPASMSQSAVHVVPGWLTGYTGPLKEAPGGYVDGLPQRAMGPGTWLLDDPSAALGSVEAPQGGVRLQNYAYTAHASDPPAVAEPIPGLWAVAPRLEGGGCPDRQRTCWQWNLLGRVSYQEADNVAEPVETPSLGPSPTVAPSPSAEPPTMSTPVFDLALAETSGGDFELRLEAGSGVYVAGQPIDVSASFTALGFTDDFVLGSGGRLQPLRYYRVDGELEMTGPVVPAMCSNWAMGRGDPLTVTGQSSRGVPFIAQDDPNADFYRQWLDSDMLWLPAGTWRIVAEADFWLGSGCSELVERVQLATEIWLTVVPEGEDASAARTPLLTDTEPSDVCLTAQVSGTLVAHDESGLGLRIGDEVWSVVWPYGYSASESAEGLVLHQANGQPVARVGDYIESGGGYDADRIYICGAGDVLPDGPSLTPGPPQSCASTTEPGSGDVLVHDHVGLVVMCGSRLGAPIDEGIRATNPDGDTTRLLIEWSVAEQCRSMPVTVDVWVLNEEAGGGLFVAVELLRPAHPDPCFDQPVTKSVELSLARATPSEDVSVTLTEQGSARDSVETPMGAFEVAIETDQTEYTAREPIEMTSTLTYAGPNDPQRLSSFVMSHEYTQLDGDLNASFGYTGECIASTITRDEPIVQQADNSIGFFDGDVDGELSRDWREADYLWLPPGEWRVTIRVITGVLAAGEARPCAELTVQLSASIVITVSE